MNWDALNSILGMTSIWAQASLRLMLDKEAVAIGDYCAPAVGRDGGQVLRPDAGKVKAFLKRGATLVANDIDGLSPQLTGFSGALEQATLEDMCGPQMAVKPSLEVIYDNV